MTLYDRDYYRESYDRRSVGLGASGWSVTTWLIVINVAVFLIDQFLAGQGTQLIVITPAGGLPMPPLEALGHFSLLTAVDHYQVWRFFTFQFLHANLWHLLFNMISLYFFGRFVEDVFGSWRFLVFYLLCGVAGAVGYVLLWATHILNYPPWTPLVGASAGIFGILIGAARMAPNAQVNLLLFFVLPVPMRLRTLAYILIGVAVFNVLTGGVNAGGEAGHLGGAALGYLLVRNPRWLAFADRISPSSIRLTTHKGAWDRKIEQKQNLHQEVDRILAKIHDHGMQSLTWEERQTLHRASRDTR